MHPSLNIGSFSPEQHVFSDTGRNRTAFQTSLDILSSGNHTIFFKFQANAVAQLSPFPLFHSRFSCLKQLRPADGSHNCCGVKFDTVMLRCLLYSAQVLWENRCCCIKPCSYGNHGGSVIVEDCGLLGSGGAGVDFILLPHVSVCMCQFWERIDIVQTPPVIPTRGFR